MQLQRALRYSAQRLPLACVVVFALSACERAAEPQTTNDVTWAQVALSRNPNLEIVATDNQTGVFTVRMKRTGEVRAIKLNELAAVPVSELTIAAVSPAPVSAPAPIAAVVEPASAPPEPASQPVPESALTAAAPATGPAVPTETTAYTIDRSGGQVKISGPGVSIVSSGPTGAKSPATDLGQRSDPVICEGKRMLHLDNRTLYVDGDAITARGGCELYITNSRIVASGIGIVARDAVVHIANSQIEGATASIDAGSGAKVFARGSTFQGVSRRDQRASVQDQGGNQWR